METIRIFGFLILLAVYVIGQTPITVPSSDTDEGSGGPLEDDCLSNPCLNGGTCKCVGAGCPERWTCDCPTQFTGEACENDGNFVSTSAAFHLDVELIYRGKSATIQFNDILSPSYLRFAELFCAWISQLAFTTTWGQYLSSCDIHFLNRSEVFDVDGEIQLFFHDTEKAVELVDDLRTRFNQEDLLTVIHIIIHVTDTEPCATSPCENGGICHENMGHEHCDCSRGYEGIFCAHEINECESTPCQNGGTCQDLLPGFECICALGWQGTICHNSGGVPEISSVEISVDGTDPSGNVKWIVTWMDNSQMADITYEVMWYAQERGLLNLTDPSDRTLLKTSTILPLPTAVSSDTLDEQYVRDFFGKDLIVEMRAAFTVGSIPIEWSPYNTSAPFKTGYDALHKTMHSVTANPTQGAYTHIIELFTPVICKPSYVNLGKCSVEVRFKMFYVEAYDIKYGASCQSGYEMVPTLVTDGCGLSLPRTETPFTASKQFLAVYYNTPGRARRVLKIYMYTENVPASPLWSNIDLGYFYVIVLQPLTVPSVSLACKVYNDPHIAPFEYTTFSYYDYHPVGTTQREQIIYNYAPDQHTNTNHYSPYIPKTIVTSIFSACEIGSRMTSDAYCQCGVAVRVANDVIVIYTCKTDQRQETNLPKLYWYAGTLDSSGSRLKPLGLHIYRQGFCFLISLPTGASVKLCLYKYGLINIQVNPSLMDFDRTNGMCGRIQESGVYEALVKRDGTPVTQKSDLINFGADWQANQEDGEKLILAGISNMVEWPITRVDNKLCQCSSFSVCVDKELTRTCILKNSLDINRQLRNEDAKRRGRGGGGGGGRTRGKRDIEQKYIHYDDLPMQAHHRQKREVITLNDDEVYETCERDIRNSTVAQMCYNYIPETIEDAMISCRFDLGLTSDVTFVQLTLETVKIACQTHLNNNPLLTNNTISVPDVNITDTESDTTISPPRELDINGGEDIFGDLFCPNDCSTQGTCADSLCSCDPGWAGADCSQNITATPELVEISSDDVCDQMYADCSYFGIEGQKFVDSDNLTCAFQTYQLPGTAILDGIHTTKATYILDTVINCVLPWELLRHNLTEGLAFNVSVQNSPDGQFSDSLEYLVYLSACQSCNLTDGCTTRSDKCKIDDGLGDVCWQDGERSPDHICRYCDSTVNSTVWTTNISTYCFIDSKCYVEGEENPSQPGENCDPDTPFSWTEIDECSSNPCANSGTCHEGMDSYNCTCPAGWSGVNCEDEIRECLSQPCKNGGICTDDSLMYACVCTSGFTGVNCETDVNECSPDPCDNGNCTEYIANYVCRCVAGWMGKNCSEDKIECSSNPCRNGGTCNEKTNRYTCTCLPVWTGVFCEDPFTPTTTPTTPTPTTTTTTPAPTHAPTQTSAPSIPESTGTVEETVTTVEPISTTPTDPEDLYFWHGWCYLQHLTFTNSLYNRFSVGYRTLAADFEARIQQTARRSLAIRSVFRSVVVTRFSPGSVWVNFTIGLLTNVSDSEDIYEYHVDLKQIIDGEIAKENGTFSDWRITDVYFIPQQRPTTVPPVGPSSTLIAIIATSVCVALLLIIFVTCLIFYYRPRQERGDSSAPSESSFTDRSASSTGTSELPTRYTPYGIGLYHGKPTWSHGARW